MSKEIEMTCTGCEQVWVFTEQEVDELTLMVSDGQDIVSRELAACPKCNVEVDAEQAHVGHA